LASRVEWLVARYQESIACSNGLADLAAAQAKLLAGGSLKNLTEFCAEQETSHKRLRAADPGFREYHRGAQTAYEILLEQIGRQQGETTTTFVAGGGQMGDDSGDESEAEQAAQVHPQGSPERRLVEQRAADARAKKLEAEERNVHFPVDDDDESGPEWGDSPSPRAEAEEQSRFDRVLEQREEARAGEDHWKSQRDAALNLLRWLIGDLLPPGSSAHYLDDERSDV
jgi:hypothetical protein